MVQVFIYKRKKDYDNSSELSRLLSKYYAITTVTSKTNSQKKILLSCLNMAEKDEHILFLSSSMKIEASNSRFVKKINTICSNLEDDFVILDRNKFFNAVIINRKTIELLQEKSENFLYEDTDDFVERNGLQCEIYLENFFSCYNIPLQESPAASSISRTGLSSFLMALIVIFMVLIFSWAILYIGPRG